jgi:DNA-3-methyladenine glycosylase
VKPLPRPFFERHPRIVARALLGKVLVRRLGSGEVLSGRIVETEAYLGADDAAAHAAAGKTSRNAVLFGPAGHAYVYFTYGMHYCLNVSCEPEGKAGCVLFRAFEPLTGIQQMAALRGTSPDKPRLIASGPARLCAALAIDRDNANGVDMTSAGSGLYIADDGFRAGKVRTATRIGITKSPDLPLRFYLEGNAFVSRRS